MDDLKNAAIDIALGGYLYVCITLGCGIRLLLTYQDIVLVGNLEFISLESIILEVSKGLIVL